VEGEKIRILLIEDNPGDARLIRELLAEGGGASFDLEHVDCLSKGLTRLAQGGVDIVLLDLTLPDSHDLDGLGKILAQTLEVPIVVLSGLSDERVTIKAVRGGAQDFLVKGKIDSNILVRALRYAIERQRLRVALRESEARYRLLADNIADVIWTADSEARITYVSPSIKRVLGYTVEETLKLKISDILTPDSTEQARRFVKWQMKTFAKGVQYPPTSMTLEHVRKDGSTVWAEVMLSFMQDKNGNVTGIMGATRDITERKKTEEALRESEQRYRLLAENIKDVIWTVDMNLRLSYTSPSITQLTGYRHEEYITKTLEEILTPASAKFIANLFAEELALENSGHGDLFRARTFEVELICKDGSTVPVEMKATALRDADGRPIRVLGVSRDITERRKAEEALKESETRFRTVFEGTSLGIALVDFDGKALSINPAFERMIGYNMEEFKEIEGSLKYLHPDDAIMDAKLYIEMLKGKREHYTVDKRYIRKDGEVIWGRQNLSAVRGAEGKPKYFVAMVEDITERKKTENALRESEEKLRRYLESSPDAIYIHDLKGTFLRGNNAGEELLGYSADEIEGKSFLELPILPPEYLPKAIQLLQLSAAGKPTGPDEFELIRKDGSHVFVEISAYPMTQGDKIEVIGIARDITERKKMEQELRRLSDAVNMSKDSFAISDMEGRIIEANEAALKMHGVENKADLIGRGALELIAPEDHEMLTDKMAKALETGSLPYIEYHCLKNDGSKCVVEASISVMKDKSGEPTGYMAVARDITERKRMEDALRQSEQSYRVLLESTHDSIIVVDAETFKVTFGNRRASLMFGFDPVLQDAVGVNLLDFIHPEDREIAIEGFVKDLYQAERRRRYDVRAKTRDGREIWVSALGTRIEFQGRIAVLLSLRDITKDKQMEEEKRKLEEQIQLTGRLAAVGELAAGVAHELNNPITAIKGYAQLLTKKKELDEPLRKDLETIYRESQRAARITQNLLSFARKHEPEKHLISINEVIEKTLELRAHPMKVNNIEVIEELDADLPKTLADFHQMQQVFVNIINNAEQAMTEAHGKGRLVVKTKKVRDMIQISFADDGPGIPEDNTKRIFDPFFTTKEVGKGTGLGLSICYGLVEAHGGRIYARSKLGQGATFVVEIPIVSEDRLVAEAALLNPGSRGVTWKKPREQY